MKILIVSWYFPPVNTIGALRVGAFARFMHERGHEVRVVSGKYWGHPETLPVGIPVGNVSYVKSVDVNELPGRLLGGIKRLLKRFDDNEAASSVPPATPQQTNTASPSLRQKLSALYTQLTNIPDNRVGWLPWAYSETQRIATAWKPDFIFASGPPFTALIAAGSVAARHDIPFVAELRDRWADDPYDEVPRWRAKLDAWLERRVLGRAVALVTVSEPWGRFYAVKYGKPVANIYNGYDPRDFEADEVAVPARNPHLIIGYAGGIYPGRRDPTPLFLALKLMGDEASAIRVVFCGTNPDHVWPLAERAEIGALVEVRPGVPHRQSLDFQRAADVLLLMQWNDPREQGNCPGKFFEYVASLRPVLVLGLEDGVPATILKQRDAGMCLNDPAAIAAQLRVWLAQWKEFGRVPSLPVTAREGLSRDLQFAELETFLEAQRKPSARA